jgi:Fe-S cluster assembly protein SufD
LAELALLTSEGKPALAKEDVRRLAAARAEVPAAVTWRLRALDTYRNLAIPDRVRHLWRYTDPAALLPRRPLPTPAATVAAVYDATVAGPAVFVVPGEPPELNEQAAAAGVAIAPLFRDPADAGLVGTAVPANHGIFEALNAAAYDSGLAVRIPRGVTLAEPLRIVLPAVAETALPRLLVVAESGSRAVVVEEHRGGTGEQRVYGVSEVIVEPDAELHHMLIEQWGPEVVGHLTVRGLVARDGRYHGVTAVFGGRTVKLDLGGILAGGGARSELVGVSLGEKRQHFDLHTLHHHRTGNTWSNIDYKVALADRSRSAYTGLIRIDKGAPQSEAYQENRNLLLSRRCRAEAIPELEILTDDVSCTHGATVAPVDPEQIFYLQSRGLDPVHSLRLVVRGFLETTLARLPDVARPALEELVAARLANLGGGR